MKFTMPRVGQKIKLIKDWYFILFREHRNNGMISRVDPTVQPVTGVAEGESVCCILPAGTVLEISTVAITNKKDRNYIMFTIRKHPDDASRPKYHKPEPWYQFGPDSTVNPTPQKLTGARFWVRLSDAEGIEYEGDKE